MATCSVLESPGVMMKQAIFIDHFASKESSREHCVLLLRDEYVIDRYY